ncbi:hypothetical protein [Streptomyces sp. NPDC058424]|uniref:zinc finger domain-containing protein n=1 Tax=Streptomyces sp. NPDC058424 TaxID=3346491 RepID=UPI003646CC45
MSAVDHPEHAIRCPWCRAPAGQRCTTPTGRPIAIPSHGARIAAWTAQATQTGVSR